MKSLFITILGALLLIFNINYSMDSVTFITDDLHEIQVDRILVSYLKTIESSIADTEDAFNSSIEIPVSFENCMLIFPLLSIINEMNADVCYSQLRKRLFQERTISASKCIELLNAANFLNCTTLIDFFLTLLAEDVVKKMDKYSQDSMLEWILKFDIPYELSVGLGRKIIEYNSDNNELFASVSKFLENKHVVACTFSADKKLCAYVEGKEITVIDRETGVPLWSRKQSLGTIKELCFLPDGLSIAFAAYVNSDISIQIHSLETKKNTARFFVNNKENKEIKMLSFSKNSKFMLLSLCNDEYLKFNLKNSDKAYEIFRSKKNSGPIFYTTAGDLVADPTSEYKKKLGVLCATNTTLIHELYKLPAEYAFLFIKIIQDSVDSVALETEFSQDPLACAHFTTMIQRNPGINKSLINLNALLRNYDPIENSSWCTIS